MGAALVSISCDRTGWHEAYQAEAYCDVVVSVILNVIHCLSVGYTL